MQLEAEVKSLYAATAAGNLALYGFVRWPHDGDAVEWLNWVTRRTARRSSVSRSLTVKHNLAASVEAHVVSAARDDDE